jgi:hypothetical protein
MEAVDTALPAEGINRLIFVFTQASACVNVQRRLISEFGGYMTSLDAAGHFPAASKTFQSVEEKDIKDGES